MYSRLYTYYVQLEKIHYIGTLHIRTLHIRTLHIRTGLLMVPHTLYNFHILTIHLEPPKRGHATSL